MNAKAYPSVEEQEMNLSIFNGVKSVPAAALREIQAGRLRGKSDISPMWRIQKMTEVFGACGIGWKYEIVKQWLEPFEQQIRAFCNINLYVKIDNEWSAAIPGTGGSSFVDQEKNGPYVSDECYKMAITDALSVSMKALGVAADVYFGYDGKSNNTKYNTTPPFQDNQGGITPVPAAQPANSTFKVSDLEKALKDMREVKSREELEKVWYANKSLTNNKEFLDVTKQMSIIYPKKESV